MEERTQWRENAGGGFLFPVGVFTEGDNNRNRNTEFSERKKVKMKLCAYLLT